MITYGSARSIIVPKSGVLESLRVAYKEFEEAKERARGRARVRVRARGGGEGKIRVGRVKGSAFRLT